ncbi:MAG TPA: hypothetical protein VLU43_06750 [Anaeromyxobacteraceae bacterium]|nr:hypothetical protein [Anaeromyxobacteraceae bacterium]
MPFEPEFMRRLDAFRRELGEVRGAAAWSAFKRRWFADQPWPQRSAEAMAALRPGDLVVAGGRAFVRAPLPLDLGPDARYEYFAALQAGFAAVFARAEDAPGGGGSAVRFQCPACEMWTDDPGPDACPACERPLLRLRREPPRGA